MENYLQIKAIKLSIICNFLRFIRLTSHFFKLHCEKTNMQKRVMAPIFIVSDLKVDNQEKVLK